MTAKTQTATPAQRRVLDRAIDLNEGVMFPSTVHARTLRSMQEHGWVTTVDPELYETDGYPAVTREGYIAARKADRFALADVRVGDLVAYVSHPECVVEVVAVRDGGRVFDGRYVSMCADCSLGESAAVRTGQTVVMGHRAYLVEQVDTLPGAVEATDEDIAAGRAMIEQAAAQVGVELPSTGVVAILTMGDQPVEVPASGPLLVELTKLVDRLVAAAWKAGNTSSPIADNRRIADARGAVADKVGQIISAAFAASDLKVETLTRQVVELTARAERLNGYVAEYRERDKATRPAGRMTCHREGCTEDLGEHKSSSVVGGKCDTVRNAWSRLVEVTDGDIVKDTTGLIDLLVDEVRDKAMQDSDSIDFDTLPALNDLAAQHRDVIVERLNELVEIVEVQQSQIADLRDQVARLRQENGDVVARAFAVSNVDTAAWQRLSAIVADSTKAKRVDLLSALHSLLDTWSADRLDAVAGKTQPAAEAPAEISETHDIRKDVELDALVSHAAIWCARCARLVRTAAGVVTPAGATLCRGESDAERRVREDEHEAAGLTGECDPDVDHDHEPVVEPAQPEGPVEVYVTFGVEHYHPVTLERLGNSYAVVTGPTYDAARAAIFHAFGRDWAFGYRTAEAAGVDKYSLRLVPTPQPCDGYECGDVCVNPKKHSAGERQAYGLELLQRYENAATVAERSDIMTDLARLFRG